MLKNAKFAALAIVGALAIQPAWAEDKSAAMVNGVSIPQARIDFMAKGMAARGQQDGPEMRKELREIAISQELMAQEAVKLGLDKKEDVVTAIELSRQSVLINAFQQEYVKSHPISEDQIQQEYDKLKAKLGNKEYNARHILVASEEEAKSIIAQLGKKAKFEKLAEKSLDTGSAQQGGSLGWAPAVTYVPQFANALTGLQKGQYTKEPVQSQFGWHVIKLDDVRELKVPPFDELKPQLQQRLQQQSIQKAIADLKAKAKVE